MFLVLYVDSCHIVTQIENEIFVPHAKVSRGVVCGHWQPPRLIEQCFLAPVGSPGPGWGWWGVDGGHGLEPCLKARALLAQ